MTPPTGGTFVAADQGGDDRCDATGQVDLGHLEELLQDPKYQGRLRIGSFSAASNVTGIKTDVKAVATLLHKYGVMACFDYAACAPYVDIDMNPEPEDEGDDPSIDAVFISPHKFLGGPGSSGVLELNQRIYHGELPPSVGAGGTVLADIGQGGVLSGWWEGVIDAAEEEAPADTAAKS